MGTQQKKKSVTVAAFKKLYQFVVPYRKAFYGSLCLSIVMAFLAPIRPYFIQLTVNKSIHFNHPIPTWVQHTLFWENENGIASFIIHITIFQLIFIVVESFLRFLFSFITAWLGQHVIQDLRIFIFEKILGLQLRQFDTTPIGTLTTRTINDIESINDVFSDGFIPIVADLLTIIITLVTMFYINWQVAAISLLPFPFLIVATYFFKESVNKSFNKVRNAVAALNAFVQEHITGMHVVQAFAAEPREMDKFININKQHRNANIKAIFAYSVFFPVVELVLAISTGLLVWYVANKRLDAGLLVAFILYLNQIFRPLRVIADKFNVLQMGMIAAERVFTVLENKDVDNVPIQNTTAFALLPSVEFKNVWFAYTQENYVLKNINFTIEAGKTLAIVGQTGSGKTSIINILNKLYPIQKGNIFINHQDIHSIPNSVLRTNIGVVLQDVFLFSGTILDNITLRNPSITQQQVEEAAKLIGVHNFIMQLPNNYHFNVMERGGTLSVGQRQLLSFIRAVLYNPQILILDEATSSIDTESELLIQHAIDTLIKGRTSIVVAHRLSTIRKADAIMVLDKGEIKEMGTHAELLALNGYYHKLYQMQFDGVRQ